MQGRGLLRKKNGADKLSEKFNQVENKTTNLNKLEKRMKRQRGI